jgi:hypothetical protein
MDLIARDAVAGEPVVKALTRRVRVENGDADQSGYNLLLSSALTAAGSAWPRLAFIT